MAENDGIDRLIRTDLRDFGGYSAATSIEDRNGKHSFNILLISIDSARIILGFEEGIPDDIRKLAFHFFVLEFLECHETLMRRV